MVLHGTIQWDYLKRALKITNARVPPPEVMIELIWGAARICFNSPSHLNVQPKLRTTAFQAYTLLAYTLPIRASLQLYVTVKSMWYYSHLIEEKIGDHGNLS